MKERLVLTLNRGGGEGPPPLSFKLGGKRGPWTTNGAASILLPSPAAASVIGGGALLENFLGVPVFVWVGIVAGLGEALGEFSGYAAGYGGRFILENRPGYPRIHGWMERHGTLTMFLMSTVPNPLFDVAGLAAGAVRMPMGRFF